MSIDYGFKDVTSRVPAPLLFGENMFFWAFLDCFRGTERFLGFGVAPFKFLSKFLSQGPNRGRLSCRA
jgi:hypothetical protein